MKIVLILLVRSFIGIDDLIGVFQRTDLIKLDFKDMSIFDYPISTFISSVTPFDYSFYYSFNHLVLD